MKHLENCEEEVSLKVGLWGLGLLLLLLHAKLSRDEL